MQCRVDWQRWRHVLELRYWQVQELVRYISYISPLLFLWSRNLPFIVVSFIHCFILFQSIDVKDCLCVVCRICILLELPLLRKLTVW